ncbi:MAG: DNA-directed RNA polymerase subunit A' [Candidatus Nitrosocaldus sp.]|nr:DNA-directed RNA polymerase subunit A' [Candidatus Nitrosocaldus sp.]MDW8274751.1 DNA-directed RNA polymerase subunit A' [Candidatus Nitrosocaldus sp.]
MSITEEVTKVIAGIKFAVWSPSEIRRYSVAEITAPETYDEDGLPVQGGLMDSRLGILEPGQKCATCGNTSARCPGHFGHIELAEPVLHISFVDDIYQLLQVTCRGCSRLRLSDDELAEYRARLSSGEIHTQLAVERIKYELVEKAKKVKICPHCGKEQYDITFVKPTTFHERTEKGEENRLLPVAIRERLSNIPDDDLRLLGYNPETARPEWFILQVLPVAPVTVRPSIILETGMRSEDDLTHKLVDIIRVNQRLKESKEAGTPPLIVQDLVDLLQYHVTTYFDNEVSGIPQAHHRSGRPLKTLSQRLKGKEGRFRGSLSGKRVDFAGRTVISPDPNLDISEVGVPEEIAKKLTIPEVVSPWNIDRLRALIINGPNRHPGANYIVRPDGVKIRLDYVADRRALAESLAPGFMVERHLMDGDIVIFNRQPSLHRISIMAHLVKVLPYRTFRLHPSVCPPYNADFDGDEMNLHVPQSVEARAEAKILMQVHDQLISPRYGGPIIGGIRDFITAAYLLTKDDTLLSKEEFVNLAFIGGVKQNLSDLLASDGNGSSANGGDGDGSTYTGKQLFSLLLPKDFNYTLVSKWMKSAKTSKQPDVIIKNGRLMSGVIDKASIGAEEPDSILHRLAKDYGTSFARSFLDSLFRMLTHFITHYGFSYGYDDLLLPEEARKEIEGIVKGAYEKVYDLIRQYREGTLQPIRGLSPEETLELQIVNELSRARDRAGRTADRSLPDNNAGVIMASTGARGSTLNIGQMTAILGQQSIRGKRIERGYQRRVLPHFLPDDTNPDARGFVKSNFRDGLNPLEFFFHAMGGREGLVDTAVRTQQSGYLQRRLINAMEHLRIEYDHTVRDSFGNIVQFMYGEDSVDPAKSDHGSAVNIERLVNAQALIDEKAEKATDDEVMGIVEKYASMLNPSILDVLKAELMRTRLSRDGVERVCRHVVELFERARAEPGEAIGIVAAQSIGEPGTQMTLRTFHFAGIKERNVTLGLPRLIELLDARKKPETPTMDIYLLPEYSKSRESALEVARNILFTKLNDLVESVEVDVDGALHLVLSASKMSERGCDTDTIVNALRSSKKKLNVSVDGDGMITIRPPAGTDARTMSTLKGKILNTKIKGIPEIERVTVVKQGDEWVIQTAGSNLQKVLDVDGVDATRTTTNNIYEIANVLGIEAARTALVKEITNTLEEQGLEVDIRHIMLVADVMTSKGMLQQIGRHGVAGTKVSVLARAAFEITVPTIAEAALKGEIEPLRGVTENVIVGSTVPVGTGMVDLYMKVGNGSAQSPAMGSVGVDVEGVHGKDE